VQQPANLTEKYGIPSSATDEKWNAATIVHANVTTYASVTYGVVSDCVSAYFNNSLPTVTEQIIGWIPITLPDGHSSYPVVWPVGLCALSDASLNQDVGGIGVSVSVVKTGVE